MQTIDSATLAESWLKRQRDRQAHPDLYKLRSTGLKGLDAILGGGVELGQVIIYGGEQKIGKSTLLQHTVQSFAAHRDPFVFFSGEMNTMSIGTRLFSNISGIDKNKIRGMGLELNDWGEIDKAAGKIMEFPGWWNYGFKTIDDIRKVLREIKEKTGTTVQTIFVDYVQLMEQPGVRDRQEQLSTISRTFKRMSIEEEKPMLIFLAAQLNRQSIRGHIIDANSFLGSGAFERDMDVGIVMSYVRDQGTSNRIIPNLRELIVVGSRETEVGTCKIMFNGKLSKVRDQVGNDPVDINKYWA